MGALSKDTFAGVTYAVMGMGTEGGRTPYQVTVAANGGWNGTPIAASGYSVGAMQFDFGQRSGTDKNPNIDPLNGKPYNVSFVDAVNGWAKSVGQAELSTGVADALRRPGNSAKFSWIDSSDRDTMRAFGQTPEGQTWINNHLEKGLIREYEPKVNTVLASSAFNGWTESDLIVAASVLTKAQNQSPNGGFNRLDKTVQQSAAETTNYTLDDFLADTKAVEATNKNFHFTKAADIAKDYVTLRNSDEVGPILKAVEAKISSADFSPTSIGPDGDLWLTHKITSDPKFRASLVAAAAQASDNESDVSIKSVGSGQQKALIIVVPEGNYLEIQAPKGQQSVIIKDGRSFFYDGGDAEGRHFAIKSLEAALSTEGIRTSNDGGTGTAYPSTPNISTISSMIDTAVDKAINWVVGKLPPELTQFFEPGINTTGTDGSDTHLFRIAAPVAAKPTNHHTTGAIYISRDGASATLANGDVISAGPNGKLSLDNNGNLILTRPVNGFGAEDGSVFDVIQYNAKGQVIGRSEVQVIPDPEHPGDPTYNTRVVQGQTREITITNEDGSTTVVQTVFQVGLGWVDSGTSEVVQDIKTWQKGFVLGTDDPTNPLGANAVNGADLQSDLYKPPTRLAENPPTTSTTGPTLTPVAFVPPNSDGYTAGPNGTFNRPVLGQSDLLELRDSYGSGYIVDTANGTIVAVLQPGDQVGTTSEQRISINDDNGQAVDRTTEAGRTGIFVALASSEEPATLTGSDAHFLNHPAPTTPETSFVPVEKILDALGDPVAFSTNPGIQLLASTDTFGTTGPGHTLSTDGGSTKNSLLAPVESDGNAAVLVATGSAPSDTDAPDPYDVRFTNHANDYQARLYDAQVTDAGTALSFANSLLGLRNWDSQNDLGHLSSLVGLYNTYNQLGGAVNAVTTGSSAGGGAMGQFGAGLGFITALDSGNPISIASSGASFVNAMAGYAVIPVPVIGALNIANALESGDPFAIASSVAAMFPPWGTVASIVISIIGGLVPKDIPEPPNGTVHYEWDETGAIQIQTDYDISEGASIATGTAGNVLGLLNSVVTAQNTTNDAAGLSHNNLGIDPSRMPRIGHTAGTSWMEITHPDGTVTKETINPATIGQRLLEVAVANDALAPAWQIDTARAHAKTTHAQAVQAQADAQAAYDQAVQETQAFNATASDGQTRALPQNPNANTHTGMEVDGQAPAGPAPVQVNLHNNASVFGTKGIGTESADHKTISYGALVVHLGTPGAQQAINDIKTSSTTTTSTALSDTDGDGFWEQTQWVAGQDKDGNVQGMLVLDSNANGLIETADILHLGADSNQRNSMNWLDANGDGKLDASDPAFAAIKVFIDLNNNGRVDSGEMQSPGLSSINFTTGQINYSNGTSDALTVATLTAETEGARVETIKFVGEDGKLYETSAGSVTVHEGYQGLVRVNNKGEIVADDDPAADNRWVQQRINSYEFDAVHMRDWEGTDAQDQHRHGGKNVEGAPTATTVTGVSSMGAVLGKENVKTSTTMDVGDKRIVSDAPRTHTVSTGTTTPANPTTITLNAGDARIRSLTPPAESTTRVAFVPSGVRDGWMTADGKELLHLPEDNLFGNGGMGGALMAVAMGAVQTTAFALPEPGATGFTWQTKPMLPNAPNTDTHNSAVNLNTDRDGGNDSAFNIAIGNYTPTVRHVRLGVQLSNAPVDHPAHVPTYVVGNGPAAPTVRGGWQTTVYDIGNPPLALAPDGSPQPSQTLIYNPATGKPTTSPTPTTNTAPAPVDSAPGAATTPSVPPASSTSPTPVTTPSAPTSPTFTAPPASPPTNTSAGTTNDNLSNPLEDLPLHVDFATLLANDTNASSITLVGNATHGTVAIVGSQVVFTPTPNYHGPASFQYQVVSTDGSFAVGQANFDINAANDVPVALGETATATEDTVLLISPASLLANDTDADVATDGQTLSISAVGNATHGTVSLVNGQVQFTADANYHGTASFKYVVSDGHGGTATATATVQVAAVNDLPVALGEVIASAEDTTLLINPAALLANDTDADIATDNQVLSISAVSNATHGTVSILGTGQIQFIPDANYVGNASFDYVVSDGHGGTVTTTANILVGSTNDAPVASGETVNSQEDQVVTLTAAALLANETDIDNTISSLQIARVTAGAGGSVVLSNGNVIFTPNANFSGTASFTYWVKDPDGMESNPATVTVNVAPVNDAPYAQGEVLSGASEDATFTIDRSTLLANDGDEEDGNGSLGIELVGGASSGTVSIGAGGNVVFTPVANFNGNVSFQYQVRDSSGALSPTVTAQFNVAAVNDTPLGVDEQLTPMYTNTSASPTTATIGFTTLLANDQDVDNPPADLTVSGVRNANNGTVSIVNGAVSFTPTLNFNGTASFEYLVDDQHGGQTWATAFISVAPPPNLYPTINVTHFNFYATGTTPAGAWDIGELNWTIGDDGNTSLVSVTYLSGSFHVFGNAGGNVSSLPWNRFDTTQTSWYVDVPREHAVDGFTTTWRVVDERGLENTWTFSYTVGSAYSSTMQFAGYAPPVVLALYGGSPCYTETQYSNVRFDLNGDGVADQVAWAGAGSGVLGIDLNGDHQITDANEFAFAQYVSGAKTDLEGLRAFDSNQNGHIDAGDALWNKFGVWEDKNADGVTQDGEYNTLDTLGIATINLNGHAPTQPQAKPADGHLTGVAVVGESTFTRTDGTTGQVDDAMLAFQAAPPNDAADLMRMALLFNQYSNTALDGGHAPLGHVPMQAETPWQDAAIMAPSNAMQEAVHGA